MSRLIKLILIFFIFSCWGCSKIMLGLYGIRDTKKIGNREILDFAKKSGIGQENIYVLSFPENKTPAKDNTKIAIGNGNVCTSDPVEYLHGQPLQALYFNCHGQLISFHNNCYTGGFPNLKWDRNDLFSVFPPRSRIPVDSVYTLEKVLENVYSPDGEKATARIKSDCSYYCVVFWNVFMSRQSKRLIRLVQDNLKLVHEPDCVEVFYINDDNYFNTLFHDIP